MSLQMIHLSAEQAFDFLACCLLLVDLRPCRQRLPFGDYNKCPEQDMNIPIFEPGRQCII